MGLPKKRSRKIVVDTISYRYIITGNDDYIDLIIEQEDVQGQRMTVSFKYHSAKMVEELESGEKIVSLTQRNQITPSVVKQTIQFGLENGWTPAQKGKEIRTNFIDNEIELNLLNID